MQALEFPRRNKKVDKSFGKCEKVVILTKNDLKNDFYLKKRANINFLSILNKIMLIYIKINHFGVFRKVLSITHQNFRMGFQDFLKQSTSLLIFTIFIN